jgi:phage terminase Nu1 subunit (DNA packaging protein)
MTTVNLQRASELLGRSANTIKSWFRQGCPVVQKGNQKTEWQIKISDVLAWREEQAIKSVTDDLSKVDEQELKRRKLEAETTILEIEAAKKRGEVAPLHEMEIAWRDAILEFKTRLRLIPSRVAGQLVGLDNETEIKAVLLDEVDQSLTVLSEGSC